jgi:phage baseplate assembly protein W
MAVIDLNNLIRPKQQNNPSVQASTVINVTNSVYTDLHLDLEISKSIGLGINVVQTNDIIVDHDIKAIENSIRNIFTTKKGQKILNPNFGCSLEQYLFTQITDANARAMGNDILNGITQYEPRISVSNINITPQPDQNLYYVQIYYTILEINRQSTINIIAQLGGQVLI